MRELLIIVAVFALGFFVGHDFWPKSPEDPSNYLRFHRGKMPPQEQPGLGSSPKARPTPIRHGRVWQHASTPD